MERDRLEGAAASYTYLRGLFLVPGGLLAILAALGNWEIGPLRHAWAFPVGVALIGAACLPINRYYVEHYGRIRPSTRQELRGAVAILITVAVMFGASLLLRSRAPWSLDLPVNEIAVCFAATMLISYALGAGLRAHQVVVLGALLLVGAAPVWTGADPANVGLVLAGVAMMACGVLDHRLLARTFGPPAARSPEEVSLEASG